MKKCILTVSVFFTMLAAFAQDISLSDSIIYFDKKPVAYYYKELSPSPPRYNMEVYNLKGDAVIKAEVIEFVAPVPELKPFYYYEITFPSVADTFALFHESEAFPLELSKIIRDYKLLQNDRLDLNAVRYFKSKHPGAEALAFKIRSVQNYLDQTRYFSEQVVRDRTKPVTILNDRVIMQDGVKVGSFNILKTATETNRPITTQGVRSSYGKPDVPITVIMDYEMKYTTELEVFLSNGRKIDFESRRRMFSNSRTKYSGVKNPYAGEELYELSRKKISKKKHYSDHYLYMACYLIADHSL